MTIFSAVLLHLLASFLLRLLPLLLAVGYYHVDDDGEAAARYDAANDDGDVAVSPNVIAAVTIAIAITTALAAG